MVIIAYIMLIVLLSGVLGFSLWRFWSAPQKNKEGVTPSKQPTMFMVRQLLVDGKRDKAMETYCLIFNTTPDKAKKDIEELERSLKV